MREGRRGESKKETDKHTNKEQQRIVPEFHTFWSSPSSQGATRWGDRLHAAKDRICFLGEGLLGSLFVCRLWFGSVEGEDSVLGFCPGVSIWRNLGLGRGDLGKKWLGFWIISL